MQNIGYIYTLLRKSPNLMLVLMCMTLTKRAKYKRSALLTMRAIGFSFHNKTRARFFESHSK